jgi:hypothetical protein
MLLTFLPLMMLLSLHGQAQSGSTEVTDGKYVIKADGEDIWDSADSFRFVYKEMSGDFSITVRAVSLEETNAWAKIGIMVRQTNSPSSEHAFLLARAADGNKYFHKRQTEGASAEYAGDRYSLEDKSGFPVWLKLMRIFGDNIIAFASSDGDEWKTLGAITLKLTDPVLVGIAVTSHDRGKFTTGIVDNFTINGVAPGDLISEDIALTIGGKLTAEAMHRILTLIREYIIEAHPEPFHAVKEEDFENLDNELKAECGEPMSPGEFYFLANQLVCKMKDAHTRLDYRGDDVYLPITVIWASDGLGILETDKDHTEIKHSRILSIEGVPVEEILLRLEKITSSENMEWVKAKGRGALARRSVLRHILNRAEVDAVSLQIEKDGVKKEISLPFGSERIGGSEEPGFFWDIIPEVDAGYFSLKSCNRTEEYRRAVQNLFLEMKEQGCRNLIIDLRGNGGGNSNVIDEFLRKMPGKDFLSYSARIRVSKHAIEQRGYDKSSYDFEGESDLSVADSESKWHRPFEDQRVTPFKGKVFVIVDRGTFSSGNWFAVMFSDNRLGTVVGEKTGNSPSSYGDLLRFRLPGPFSLLMSHKLFVRPDPSRDPADGLVPDVEIPTRLADYFAGRDPQMEWLIEELYRNREKPLSKEKVRSLIPKPPEGPRVISTTPENGATDVDPNLAEIKVVYDSEMRGSYSWCRVGEGEYPETTGRPKWISPTTCVLPVKLKPDTKYVIWLNTEQYTGFRARSGAIAIPYKLVFETGGR